ncbi:Carboxyl-terminal peptidase [Spatholobus suberectus]|nr:Carboxyl-terminal peptidase [Spatholobus suberectus]
MVLRFHCGCIVAIPMILIHTAINSKVKEVQMSLTQIAVQRGEQDQLNTILFGWQVSPQLYGRESPNLFAQWTSDSFKTTGCYSMLCPGFVQIHNKIILGIRVAPVSSYGGDQYDLSLSISQDPKSKNWWLIAQDINVGYYPAQLFSNMSVANFVGWGGRVYGVVNGSSAQMGSGYLPDGDLTHACFVW